MVPDCFIMSDAPYYLDIFIVHNLYPSPLTLPLPSPSFSPNKQNSSILDNPYCPISQWGGGAPCYLDIFREALTSPSPPLL